MNIGLLRILHNKKWDFRQDMAQTYANALRNAIELQLDNDIEKHHGYFLSKKGYQKEGRTVGANFEEKLYVGNIHRIENHLYWNDEELADDDEIINVVVVDGPVTRDGGGCSYGSKDWRDQVMYANTIPQVVGHLFIVNTPGGEAECRNDYDMMIGDCREKGKPTVAFIDGGCYSSGVNLTCRCDYVIVMNPMDGYGCIGTMGAFWTVAHDTVDQDGYRYVELVGKDCPEKNAWWREAAKGEYEKLQAELDKDTEEFQQTVRENRPLVTDDMLSGKVFEAQELIPALVDEIGDMERAIECVFQLADKTLTPAREATVVEDPEKHPDEQPGGEEPEELAKLNAQQKAAINKEKGNLTVVDDGHVTAEREDMFGPRMVEVAKPQNENNMPNEEEKKAQEAAAAQAAQEQEAAEQEGQEAGGAAGEGAAKGADEGAGEGSGNDAGEGAGNGEGSGEGEGNGEGSGEGAGNGEGSGEGAGDQPSDEALQNEQADIDKMTETLHNAEQMIADRDKQIAQLKESLATLKGIAEERDAAVKERNDISASLEKAGLDYAEQGKRLTGAEAKIAEHVATIETLRKQVADLRAEVKELAEKPGDMTDGTSGIPAGNGIGAPPKDMGTVSSTVSPDMTPEQIRAALRKQDEEMKARRNRR